MRTVTKSAASASSDADVQSPDTAEPVLLHHNSTSLSSLSLKSDNGTSPNVAETEAAAVAFQKRDSRNADVRELIGYASSSFSSLSLDAAEASPTTAVLSKGDESETAFGLGCCYCLLIDHLYVNFQSFSRPAYRPNAPLR